MERFFCADGICLPRLVFSDVYFKWRKKVYLLVVALLLIFFCASTAQASIEGFVARDHEGYFYQYSYEELLDSYASRLTDSPDGLYEDFTGKETVALFSKGRKLLCYSALLDQYALAALKGKVFNLDRYLESESENLFEKPSTISLVYLSSGVITREVVSSEDSKQEQSNIPGTGDDGSSGDPFEGYVPDKTSRQEDDRDPGKNADGSEKDSESLPSEDSAPQPDETGKLKEDNKPPVVPDESEQDKDKKQQEDDGSADTGKTEKDKSEPGSDSGDDPADKSPVTKTLIAGKEQVSLVDAVRWAQAMGAHAVFVEAADYYWYYGEKTGIRPEVLYAQAAYETGFGRFGGAVPSGFNNFAGIKKWGLNGDDPDDYEEFESVKEGVRAHFNHMCAYVGLSPVGEPHGRYSSVLTLPWAGTVKTVEDLSGKWAPSSFYHQRIVEMIGEMS